MTLGTLLDLQDALKNIKTSIPLLITLNPDGSVELTDVEDIIDRAYNEGFEDGLDEARSRI